MTSGTGHSTLIGSTENERDAKQRLAQHLRTSPIPDVELLDNLGIYLTRQTLSRLTFMQHLYEMILPVHGVIAEFGVRWGQNLSLFSNLRGMHEPFNYNRRILGFDTFSGFPSVDEKDGAHAAVGDYGVIENWQSDLEELLDFHNANSPIPQKKKYDLVVGDATQTLSTYLHDHPETIVALAYFDFDIYEPTRACLESLVPHLTKGSILAFDELNMPEFPGETRAVQEVLGLSRYAIRRVPYSPLTSYIQID